MSSPSISIVIPTYNSVGTIREALDSVAVQTFTDYEVIVVDDASTDDTVEVVQCAMGDLSRRRREGRVIVLDENRGPAGARNRGVEEARGEWIAFLDGDDVWVPERLATQMAVVEKQPDVGMLCAGVKELRGTEAGGPRRKRRKQAGRQRTAPPAWQASDIGLRDFIENNQVATSTVLIKKAVFEKSGGFDTQFRGPEDLDLWLRVAAKHEIVMIDETLSLYRHVPGSLSMDPDQFLPQVLRVLDKAFGDGGALAEHQEWRRAAESTQLWNAAWMAFSRGNRGQSVRYWCCAYAKNMGASRRTQRKWFRLLTRYLVGPLP